MLHLFKRVYLSFEDYIDKSKNRVVISKENGFDLSFESKAVFDAELIDFSNTVSDLIGKNKKYKNLLEFFEKLNSKAEELQKRIVVYCDVDSFLTLSISWLKIILPNCNVQTAYSIVYSNIFQSRMFGTSEVYNNTRTYSANFEKNNVTFEEFKIVYDQCVINREEFSSFITNIKEHLSIEYLIASYLYEKSCKEELKKVAVGKLEIGIQQMMYEAKMFILESLLYEDVISLFNPTVKYTIKNLSDIEKDPTFDIWFDSNIWELKSVGAPNNLSRINFKNISDKQFEKFCQHLKIWANIYNNTICKPSLVPPNVDLQQFIDVKINCLKICINGSVTDSDLDYLLLISTNLDVTRPCDTFSIFEWVENEKYNIYLIEEIRQSLAKKQFERIMPYIL